MEFQRNLQAVERGKISRKVISLIGALIIFFVLIIKWQYQPLSPVVNIIEVVMLDENQFIIEDNTTNYTQFASDLREAVVQAKKNYKHNQIQLALPKGGTAADVADIIQVVSAMNLNWQIKN